MRTDILLDENYDLVEDPDTHDLVEGASDGQHIQLLLEVEPGTLKLNPLTGVGINKQQNGSALPATRKEVLLQLEADSYTVKNLSITEQSLSIDAEHSS